MVGLLSNPDAVAKAHEELDRVVGSDRTPTFEDEKDLPYIRAIVKVVSCSDLLISGSSPLATRQQAGPKPLRNPRRLVQRLLHPQKHHNNVKPLGTTSQRTRLSTTRESISPLNILIKVYSRQIRRIPINSSRIRSPSRRHTTRPLWFRRRQKSMSRPPRSGEKFIYKHCTNALGIRYSIGER